MTSSGHPSIEELRAQAQYQQLISTRNAEVAVIWSRFNVQWLINAAFLAALTADNVLKSPRRVGAVSLAGLVFALVWLRITLRGHKWVRFWNEQLAALEGTAGFRRVFTHVKDDRQWLPIKIAALIPWAFVLIWGCVLAVSVWRGFHTT